MRQIIKLSDKRLEGYCTYCGNAPDTRDHVPSRILLDDPFPENLPVVPACKNCNESFSMDEEYFACFIECSLSGTTEPENIHRRKIQKILHRKPRLRAQIEESRLHSSGNTIFKADKARFENVLLKLARGHSTFENSELQYEIPKSINFFPIHILPEEEKESFFNPRVGLQPEVGSRGLLRQIDESTYSPWIQVQKDKYYYMVSNGGKTVRILIWNYLACEIFW